MAKPKTWQAPYGPKGDLQHYPERTWRGCRAEGTFEMIEPDWRDPAPFRAVLVYEGYARGRSAAYFLWKHYTRGTRYPMFLTDLDDILSSRTIPKQGVHATWIECKRGQNYGIRLATAAEIEMCRVADSAAA